MTKPTVAVRMNEAQIDIVLEAMEGYNTANLNLAETTAFDAMLQRMRNAHERVTNKGL